MWFENACACDVGLGGARDCPVHGAAPGNVLQSEPTQLRRFYIEIGHSVDGFLGLTESATVNLSLIPPNPAP